MNRKVGVIISVMRPADSPPVDGQKLVEKYAWTSKYSRLLGRHERFVTRSIWLYVAGFLSGCVIGWVVRG